jgi:hypothetical protein
VTTTSETKDVAVNATNNVLDDESPSEVSIKDVHYTAQFVPVKRCICRKKYETWIGWFRRSLRGICFKQAKENHIVEGLVCLIFKATRGDSPFLDLKQVGSPQTIERTFMYAVAIARSEPLQPYTEEEISRRKLYRVSGEEPEIEVTRHLKEEEKIE